MRIISRKLIGIAILGALPGCSGELSPAYPYFLLLCGREAGVEIYKTAKDVRSVYQMKRPEKSQKDVPAPYDSHGARTDAIPNWSFHYDPWIRDYPSNFPPKLTTQPSFELAAAEPYTRFEFFESHGDVSEASRGLIRTTSEHVLTKPCATYLCYGETEHRREVIGIAKLESRYGYTWEVIRPSLFQHKIVGSELKVIDLSTNEVMAVARDFIYLPRSVYGKFAGVSRCEKPGGSYEFIHASHFVHRVLQPPSYAPRRKVYESKR